MLRSRHRLVEKHEADGATEESNEDASSIASLNPIALSLPDTSPGSTKVDTPFYFLQQVDDDQRSNNRLPMSLVDNKEADCGGKSK